MDYNYVMPNNSMSPDARDGIQNSVNAALEDYDKNVSGKDDAQVVAWIKRWYKTATYKHLIIGLLGYMESEGRLS